MFVVHYATQICGNSLKVCTEVWGSALCKRDPEQNTSQINLLGILFWEYSTEFTFSLRLYPPGVGGVLGEVLNSFSWSCATRLLKLLPIPNHVLDQTQKIPPS